MNEIIKTNYLTFSDLCECGRLYKDRIDKNGKKLCAACYNNCSIEDLKRIWGTPLKSSMEWINVKDRLPRPEEPVWIYWRDREVLIGWHTYHENDRKTQPPNQGWYSWEDEKCRWANWWMPITGKPKPPEVIPQDATIYL